LINNNIYRLEQDINQLVDTNDLVELTFIEHDAQFNTTKINLHNLLIPIDPYKEGRSQTPVQDQ
jgi:hypothetical protein